VPSVSPAEEIVSFSYTYTKAITAKITSLGYNDKRTQHTGEICTVQTEG